MPPIVERGLSEVTNQMAYFLLSIFFGQGLSIGAFFLSEYIKGDDLD